MSRIQRMRRQRHTRKQRIRRKIKGTKERPRLTVFRSNRHMYVQVIDDTEGKTLVALDTLQKDTKDLRNCVEDAEKLGHKAGELLKEKKLDKIVFDRNGYKYHGIVKAIADGTRKAGITF